MQTARSHWRYWLLGFVVSAALATGTFLKASAGSDDTLVVRWSGSDGLINREIAFRTTENVDWVSLWWGPFKDTATPFVDFAKYEAVGIILPKDTALVGVAFEPEYELNDLGITLRYHCELSGLSRTPNTGSRYAFALIPRNDKKITIRPSAEDVRKGLLMDQTMVARPLFDRSAQEFPQLPLQPGGGATFGLTSNPIEVVRASAPLVQQRDPEFRLAHVMINPNKALRAEIMSSGGEPGIDRFKFNKWYEVTCGKETARVVCEIDGRNLQVRVGSRTFDLRKGNFIRIDVGADRSISATQLPVIQTSALLEGDEEAIKKVFGDAEKNVNPLPENPK